MALTSDSTTNREVLERFNEILSSRDYDALGEVLVPDFVQDMPQSGERVRGLANFRKTLENRPGGTVATRDPHISAEEPHYMMTPTFNVVRVQGNGDELTSYVKALYPDGSDWYIIALTSFHDGKITKTVDFFAPHFDAPAWRAAWVEPMDTASSGS